MSNNNNNNKNKKKVEVKRKNQKPKGNRRRNNNNGQKKLANVVGSLSRRFGNNSIETSSRDTVAKWSMSEVIGTYYGSNDYSISRYNINPGQSGTFPWLSTISDGWDRYRFTKLSFRYIPQVNEMSTYGNGTVAISFDPDAADPVPDTMAVQLNSKPRSYGLPCRPLVIVVPTIQLRTLPWYYVRPGQLPGGTDIKTYDVGMLLIGVAGSPGNNAIGTLEVDYSVEFSSPTNITNSQQPPVNFNLGSWSSTGQVVPTGSELISFNAQAFNGTNIVQSGTQAFKMPPGNWLCTLVTQLTNASGFTNFTVQPQRNSAPYGLANTWAGPVTTTANTSSMQFPILTALGDVINFVFTHTSGGGSSNLLPQLTFTAL